MLPTPTRLPVPTFSLRSVVVPSTVPTVDVVVSPTAEMEDLPSRDAASLPVEMASALRVDVVDVEEDAEALLLAAVLRLPLPVTRRA